MRVQFVLDSLVNECIGMLILSSILKKSGHTTGLSVASSHWTVNGLLREIEDVNPDLIACSVMTANVKTYETICQVIKKRWPFMPIVWGGAHPTFMPEKVADLGIVDAIAIGEADESFEHLVDNVANRCPEKTAGFWIYKGGKWIKNPIAPFPNDLDALPFPDRELLYSKSYLLRHFAIKRFLASRGCPFKCAFCFEPLMHKLYGGKVRDFVRRRSPESVTDEIEYVLQKYPGGKHLHFSDDSFNLSWPWMQEICTRLASLFGLPYTVNIEANLLTTDMADLLKETGCRAIIVGLETSNERTRRNILNKPVANEKYIRAACLMNERGIKFVTNNMIGIHGENSSDWLDTIILNRKMKSMFMRPCIFKVYRGTQLGTKMAASDFCERTDGNIIKIKHSEADRIAMDALLWWTFIFMIIPLSKKMCRKIIYSRWVKHTRFLILLSHIPDVIMFRLPIWQAVGYFLLNMKLFWKGMAHSHE